MVRLFRFSFFRVLWFVALSYSNAAEEKHTSRFKPALCSGNQDLSLQSHSKGAEASGDVDAAKVAAMQAAELGKLRNSIFFFC